MNNRLGNERGSSGTHFASLTRKPSHLELEEAVVQLEDCVKNGLLFHAAHLSDWIMFVAGTALSENRECHRRVRVERLKRLGYLHFFEQEVECRDELCETEEIDQYLDAPADPAKDGARWMLYTAIGHTLWHEENLTLFQFNFDRYQNLFSGLTSSFKHRSSMNAFLLGMKGRLAFLKECPLPAIMSKFDEALESLTPAERGTRVGLHLINYYLEHLNRLYACAPPQECTQLSNRINDLLMEFDTLRVGTTRPDGGYPRPLRTLLQVHLGLHRLRKLKVDIERSDAKLESAVSLRADFAAVQAELLFTSAMLGLGSLNPCPPLLREVYAYCNVEGDGFDMNQAKSQLKAYLIDTSWEAYEEIAAIYFRHMGGQVLVDELPEGTRTFDLLVSTPPTSLHAATITGVQVKHKKGKYRTADFNTWIGIARSYQRRSEISRIIFFSFGKPHVAIPLTRPANRDIFCNLQSDIEFWGVDRITDLLWHKPGCLPEVYAVLQRGRKPPTLDASDRTDGPVQK